MKEESGYNHNNIIATCLWVYYVGVTDRLYAMNISNNALVTKNNTSMNSEYPNM